MAEEEGTLVAGGKHVVPEGVAVEELDGGKKKLSRICPLPLEELLQRHDLKDVYDKFVDAVVKEGHTRNFFGRWKDKEFDSILDLFRADFADKGVKVALCKRTSGSGSHRWLEFIDVGVVPDYVPQYDVANMSGQVIKTAYTTLEFPNGVAVEEFKQWGHGGKSKLQDSMPIYLEKLLKEKDLMTEYHALIDDCLEDGSSKWRYWDEEKLREILDQHRPDFEKKGVEIFMSKKKEYVSHGQYGGHEEIFRWLEFVNREEQPNYHPQRDAETRKGDCVIS